jgi:hypothetical protein
MVILPWLSHLFDLIIQLTKTVKYHILPPEVMYERFPDSSLLIGSCFERMSGKFRNARHFEGCSRTEFEPQGIRPHVKSGKLGQKTESRIAPILVIAPVVVFLPIFPERRLQVVRRDGARIVTGPKTSFFRKLRARPPIRRISSMDRGVLSLSSKVRLKRKSIRKSFK